MKTFQLTRASDAGRILNPLAGRNQIEGAVVMGIGMALLEHTSYDPQSGAPINSNLADYMVAVNADVPPIEVHFVDFPNKRNQRTRRPRDRRDWFGRNRRRRHGGGPSRDRRSRAGTAGEDRGPPGLIGVKLRRESLAADRSNNFCESSISAALPIYERRRSSPSLLTRAN